MAFLQDALGEATTVHQGHMPEIDVTSDATASGIWSLNDIIIWPNDMRLDGYRHYHETYEKAGGEWRIKSSRLTRLHVRSEEHTSELQSLMRTSYALFCLKQQTPVNR